MRILEKIRRIFASDANYSKREKSDLMSNSLWDGVYDRSGVPKDGRGAIPKDPGRKVNK